MLKNIHEATLAVPVLCCLKGDEPNAIGVRGGRGVTRITVKDAGTTGFLTGTGTTGILTGTEDFEGTVGFLGPPKENPMYSCNEYKGTMCARR